LHDGGEVGERPRARHQSRRVGTSGEALPDRLAALQAAQRERELPRVEPGRALA
jgi:hypothetical protein